MNDKELLDRAGQAHIKVQTAHPIDRLWQAVDKREILVDGKPLDESVDDNRVLIN